MRSLILSAALCTLATSPVLAQFSNVTVTHIRQYQQTTADTPATPTQYRAAIFAETQSPGVATVGSVTPPGASAPISLLHEILIGDLFSHGSSFSTESQLLAAFPNGPYAFSYGGGTAPAGGFTLNANFPAFAPQVPTLTAAALANLNAVLPGQSIPITLTGTSGGSMLAVLVDPANNFLYGAISLGSTGVASFNMPTALGSNSIAPNHLYELRITLSVTSSSGPITVPGWPNRFDSATSQIETRYAFTSIPTPGALACLLGAGLFAARRRRAR